MDSFFVYDPVIYIARNPWIAFVIAFLLTFVPSHMIDSNVKYVWIGYGLYELLIDCLTVRELRLDLIIIGPLLYLITIVGILYKLL